jgi:nuclear migration protein JNM1
LLLGRFREIYAYPESRDGSPSRSPSPPSSTRKPVPLNTRLQLLQKELDTLEKAVSDPSNLLAAEAGQDPDPEAMMRGLAEIRGRLNNIGGGESRGTEHALVSRVFQSAKPNTSIPADGSITTGDAADQTKGKDGVSQKPEANVDALGHLDKRLGELESLIGASNATLDEVSS